MNALLHGITNFNRPIEDIVRLSNCCDKTVRNVLKAYKDSNEFTKPRGHKRLLDRDDLKYLEAILCAKTGLFWDTTGEALHCPRY